MSNEAKCLFVAMHGARADAGAHTLSAYRIAFERLLFTVRRTGEGRSRAYSVRFRGAILAGVAVRRAVTRRSHAGKPLFVVD